MTAEDLAAKVLQLEQAVETRDVISTAKGLLMAASKLTAAEAFEAMRAASQRQNIKVRAIAERIVHAHEERIGGR